MLDTNGVVSDMARVGDAFFRWPHFVDGLKIQIGVTGGILCAA
jgi:hypothetical protein